MKKILIMLGILLVLPLVFAFECQDQTEFWNIPCDLVTPVMTCSTNATVLDTNDATRNYSTAMIANGDGTYNYSLTYDEISTYSTVLCNNDSATIDVIWGIEEDETNFNVWMILFGVFFILFISGVYWNNYIFLFAAGSLILLMGIWTFGEGITVYGVTYWWLYPFAWILTGIGIILTATSGYEMIIKYGGGNF